jgi:hypothetical protein
MTALPTLVCEATATAPTAAPAPKKNLRREGLFSSLEVTVDFVLMACSFNDYS